MRIAENLRRNGRPFLRGQRHDRGEFHAFIAENALVRASDVHDIPCATNLSTARLMLLQWMGGSV